MLLQPYRPPGDVASKPIFRRHNSCVDFTFIEDMLPTNSYKLTRLNALFERAADKQLGGIREDKLMRLLPKGALTTAKYGMNLKNGVKVKHKDLRVISRGPFLAMFSHESVSFLNSLVMNEKNGREKRKKKNGAREKKDDDLVFRRRAQTHPTGMTLEINEINNVFDSKISDPPSPTDEFQSPSPIDKDNNTNKKVQNSDETRKKSNRKSRKKKDRRKRREEGGSDDCSTSSSSISKSRSRRKKGSKNRRSSDATKERSFISPFEGGDDSSESPPSLSDSSGHSMHESFIHRNHAGDGLRTPELCTDSSAGDGAIRQPDYVGQITFSYSSTDEEILPLKAHRNRSLPINADEEDIQQLFTESKLQDACNSSEELCSFLKSFSSFVKTLFPRKGGAMVGVAPADSEVIFRIDAPGNKEQMSMVASNSPEPRKVSVKKKRRKNGCSRMDVLSDSPFAMQQKHHLV